ncbi:KSR2 Kinase, partial [Certhia brachydactyla]|nr:KSR2 Kinase [Certhia brachydactyla]
QSKLVKYFSRQLSCKRKVALQERNAKLEGFPQLLHWFRIVDIRKEVMEEIAPGQLSLEDLLDMTDDQVCATVEKFGANSEECARLNASLSCLRSVHKSGGSLSKQDWTIQWPSTEPGKENSPGCPPEPGPWGRTHPSPKVQPKCGQHHCHASSSHGPMYTHVDRLTVEGHPGLCPPLESGHRSLPPSPRQRHAAHTPPRTPNIVTTMTPPGTPPVRRRNKLKPPGTPPPSSRKLIHLIPGFTALHRSKSHEFQLGHRVDEAHTPNFPRWTMAPGWSQPWGGSRSRAVPIPCDSPPVLGSVLGLWRGWSVSREGNGAPGAAEGAGKGAQPGEKEAQGDLVSLHNSLTGGDSQGGQALLPGNRDRRRGNGLRLGQGRIRVDFGKISSWKGWSGTGTAAQGRAGSSFLGRFKNCVDVALGDMAGLHVFKGLWSCAQLLECIQLPQKMVCTPRGDSDEWPPYQPGSMLELSHCSGLWRSLGVVGALRHQQPPEEAPPVFRPARQPNAPQNQQTQQVGSLGWFSPQFSPYFIVPNALCLPQNEEGAEEVQESEDDFEEMNLSLLSARNFPRKASQTSIFLQEWDIPFEQLEIGELIGKGRFGQVFHGRWHGEVAIRLIDIERDNEDQLKAFKREVMAYRQTRHENVVLFMGACMSPPHLAIITSLCKGRTLYSVVRDAKIVLDVNKTRQIAQEIVKGMGYLHAKGILHKDLKSKNVFYDNGKVVITDFGLFSISGVLQAGRRENKLRIQNGWLCHLAPEIIRQLSPDTEEDKLPFSKHSDVFALGTIWYELHAREWPFKTQPAEAIIWQVGRGMKPNLSQIGMGKEISDILLFCWAYEQEERPTFTKLMDMLEKLPKRNRRLSHPGHFWKSAE